MSDVGSWDPNRLTALTDEVIETLDRAAQHVEDENLGLDPPQLAALGGLMTLDHDEWVARAERASPASVIGWIRALTVLENRFPGFEAGATSPVIPLVSWLRRRDEYPNELTRWIKAHSDNRFLPYGNVLDRL